jgi:CDGSH-type Zn-finger protein
MAPPDDAEDGIVVHLEEDEPTGGATERALDPLTTITPRQDGPFVVEGTISLVGPDGTAVEHTGRTFLCRCGGSADKPLCDGSHKRNGFTAPGVPVRRKPDRP